MIRHFAHAPSLVLLIALAMPAPASAAPGPVDRTALPSTEPARRFADLIDLINSGDRAKMEQYVKVGFAPEMLRPDLASIVDFLVQQHEGGGFAVHNTLQSSAEQISVLVQGGKQADRWLRFVVNADTLPPHLVRGFFLFPGSPAMAELPTAQVPEAELPQRLGKLVDRFAADGFSGAVRLSRNGKPLLRKAAGEANRATHAPIRVETSFSVASVGKMFTAVAIAQLVEAGRLSYTDSAGRYVPDWLAPAARGITVAQLLTHQSGLGDFLEETTSDPGAWRTRKLPDYRPLAAKQEPAFTPGTDFRYSNVGYLVLGAIVEKISGQPFEDYLHDHVFAPAGMAHTSLYAPPAGQAATGYMHDEDGTWHATDSLMVGHGSPAGGSYSTVDDLAAFADALLSGKLVSRAALEQMTEPRVDMAGTGLRYGYGFSIVPTAGGGRVFGHAGGFPGVGALVEVYMDRGYTLAVLSNQTDGASAIGDAWRTLLRRSASAAATETGK